MISRSSTAGALNFESFYWLLISFFVITIFAILSVPGSRVRGSAPERDFCSGRYESVEKQELCREILADLQE